MTTFSTGIVTSRDNLTIHFSPSDVIKVVTDFAELLPEVARSKYGLPDDGSGWRVEWAQSDIKESGSKNELVVPVLYRPFDKRFTYYTGKTCGFLWRPRTAVMRHMLESDNLGFIATRQTRDVWDVLATRSIIGHKAMAAYDINTLLPLYTYPTEQTIEQGLYEEGERQPNLASTFTAELERGLSLAFISDGKGNLQVTFGPEDVFHYMYAIFHSPTYREQYEQFLRTDFPRVPVIDDLDLFRTLVDLGGQLTKSHFLEFTYSNQQAVSFPVPGKSEIEKSFPKYYERGTTPPGESAPIEQGRVYIGANVKKGNKRGQYFKGVEPEVWEFRIGGYQPMEKWLERPQGKRIVL